MVGLRSPEDFGLSRQEVPEALLQRPQESLEMWRDRLQQQYRVPFVLAALSDLKLPYVEIISPLLSGSLVEEIRKLPDHLRTRKVLLRSIVHSLSPNISFSRFPSTERAASILKSRRVVEFLRDELSSIQPGVVISTELIRYALSGIATSDRDQRPPLRKRLRRLARSHLPSWAARGNTHKSSRARGLDPNTLAFRLWLIARMHHMLAEDAASLRHVGVASG
jgi:hypothetical protein